LSIVLYNAGSAEVFLTHMESFVTIEFSYLNTAASRPYSGPFQNQAPISSDEIEAVTKLGTNLTELENNVRTQGFKISAVPSLFTSFSSAWLLDYRWFCFRN